MNTLRTTPEHLKAQAARLKAQGEKIGKTVDEIIRTVDSISAVVWSGEAATAYKKQVEQLSDDGHRMKAELLDTSEKLNQIADQYVQAEEANAEIAHSLPTDIF